MNLKESRHCGIPPTRKNCCSTFFLKCKYAHSDMVATHFIKSPSSCTCPCISGSSSRETKWRTWQGSGSSRLRALAVGHSTWSDWLSLKKHNPCEKSTCHAAFVIGNGAKKWCRKPTEIAQASVRWNLTNHRSSRRRHPKPRASRLRSIVPLFHPGSTPNQTRTNVDVGNMQFCRMLITDNMQDMYFMENWMIHTSHYMNTHKFLVFHSPVWMNVWNLLETCFWILLSTTILDDITWLTSFCVR